MYCIDCKYDLRGQAGPNCPNCGRAFEPAESDTFLADRGESRAPRRIPFRVMLFVVWTAFAVSGYLFLRPGLACGPAPQYVLESCRNLEAVVAEWSRSGVHPSKARGDYAARVPPGLSRLTQAPAISARHRLARSITNEGLPAGAVLTVYAVILLASTSGWGRGLFIALAALGVVIFVACMPPNPRVVAEYFHPGDATYVADFVYLDWSWDKRDPRDSKLVVAYEREPLNGVRRIVAFSSGLIGNVPEAEFASLEFAPPYEKPVPETAQQKRRGP